MTVLAARFYNGGYDLAADSRWAQGAGYMDSGASKTCAIGAVLVGLTGAVRYKRIIEQISPMAGQGAEDLLLRAAERIREYARDVGDWSRQGGDGAEQCDVGLLAVGPDGIWVMDSTCSVWAVGRSWHAIGSGGPEARGAMAVGVSSRKAVEVACTLDMSCGGRVDWLSMDMAPPGLPAQGDGA